MNSSIPVIDAYSDPRELGTIDLSDIHFQRVIAVDPDTLDPWTEANPLPMELV